MNAKKILSSIVPIILFFSSTLFAAEPMETLQGLFDKGISIIEDSNSSYNEKADNRDYLWSVINQLFDFKQISILAVGPMWRSFTEEQKKEFVEVFTEFLGNTYLDKIEEAYDHDKIDYLKQNIINEKKALVSTQVIRKNAVIPVNYGMINVNGEWKVYDVKLEGVSLVQNYRNQFAKILLNDSPDILIQRIKAKNVE